MKVMLHGCVHKIINLPHTQTCHKCSENFSHLLSSSFPPVSSSDSATCKTVGQSSEGWLIALQSLSGSLDKETLNYTLGSKCWIHKLPPRENENNVLRPLPEKFCTPPSSFCDFVLSLLSEPGNVFPFILSCLTWHCTKQQQSILFAVDKISI